MAYDLDKLEEFATGLGFRCQRSESNVLKVTLLDDVTLDFVNLQEERDTLVGFTDVGWHFHDFLMLCTGDATYVELNEHQVLEGIRSGDVLIVDEYLNGTLNNRRLSHRLEKLDVSYMDPGEEMRVRRLP